MAENTQDEYRPVKFYADNTKPKKAGFSKFQVGDSYYFCRYTNSEIVLLSQAYTSPPGRDNGIESVKKNEKLAKRYKFETRGKTGHGFCLKAGNGQEIAISPNYTTLSEAQTLASRLSGASFASNASAKSSSAKKAAPKKTASKRAPAKAASFTAKDGRIENYKSLSFYQTHGTKAEGFNSFEDNGAYYFHYVDGGKIVLISESYTSKRGRDNGISSVSKNIGLKSAYQHHVHKNGKHYFDLNAANHQEIATSRWYVSDASAQRAAAKLRGEAGASATSNSRKKKEEDNYPPLAFYRKNTKGKAKGFEKFKGDDGEYYFTYFENNKLALISEGYPTAAVRDVGLESVRKNMKIEKRYVQGTGADGKPGFILRAGNHKEIARSVGYGSAAAAVTGAAYLMGKRRRPTASKAKTAVKKAPAAKKKPAPKAAVVKVSSKPSKTIVAGSVAAAGLAASAAKNKPSKAATAKPSSDKESSVPVKAAAIVAAPIAAAVLGAAAVVDPKPEPKAAVVEASPVVAPAAAASAAPATATGSGIWGWLKWLLLALLALFAIFFLFKACAGGTNDVAVTTPLVTDTAAPAPMVTCWNGSDAKTDEACPAKITCWDNSFATSETACPARPVAKDINCWDGSKAVDLAGCPAEPAAPEPVQAASLKMTAPSVAGRICGSSSNVLFDVQNSTPVTVTRLGTNPQFGDSTGYSSDDFFRRLEVKYRTSPRDKSFLDLLAKSLGYGSFQDMDASMFSDDRLAQGTSGLLGFGAQHALQFSTLNVTDPSHLDAFKVRSANGTDVHFMKRCGNFMYVCQP